MPDKAFTIMSVVPAHNEGESIASLIEKILAVEVPGYELQVFIAEDGSSDSTRAEVLRVQREFPSQRVILSPESGSGVPGGDAGDFGSHLSRAAVLFSRLRGGGPDRGRSTSGCVRYFFPLPDVRWAAIVVEELQ